MKRSEFFKSVVGLVGVAASMGELSTISFKTHEILPVSTMVGDLLMNFKSEVFYFTGSQITNISTGESLPAKAGIVNNGDYQRFSSSIGERKK